MGMVARAVARHLTGCTIHSTRSYSFVGDKLRPLYHVNLGCRFQKYIATVKHVQSFRMHRFFCQQLRSTSLHTSQSRGSLQNLNLGSPGLRISVHAVQCQHAQSSWQWLLAADGSWD